MTSRRIQIALPSNSNSNSNSRNTYDYDYDSSDDFEEDEFECESPSNKLSLNPLEHQRTPSPTMAWNNSRHNSASTDSSLDFAINVECECLSSIM